MPCFKNILNYFKKKLDKCSECVYIRIKLNDNKTGQTNEHRTNNIHSHSQ